jgi:hypothetical protein
MISVARHLSMIEEGNQNKIVCFGEEIKETTFTNPKPVLCPSIGEDVDFRKNNG